MTSYQAFLEIPGREVVVLQIAAFSIEEGYNGGWSGTAMLVSRGDTPVSLGTLLGAAVAQNVLPGYPALLQLAMGGDDKQLRGVLIRSWPCVVSRVEPADIEGEHLAGACKIGLVDPVSYLSGQQIWGAYQSCSAGAIVGGALSMAGGGDGKPGLQPVIPGLPVVKITEDMREALSDIPYALAVGQPLGAWLGDFLGRVGLRLELRGSAKDGSVTMRLSDRAPRGDLLSMKVLVGGSSVTKDQAAADRLFLTSLSARPGLALRGQLLDAPSLGAIRRQGQPGAIGRLFLGPSVDLDEAHARSQLVLHGAYADMLRVSAVSRQPALRPGRLLGLDMTIDGVKKWQTAWVEHSFRSGQYQNAATLLRGDAKWVPSPPLPQPATVVSGVVDGGSDYKRHQPVPRNRLGQIPVSFPFIPTPRGEAAIQVYYADKNRDLRITLDDFESSQQEAYVARKTHWDTEEANYLAGKYNDPYSGTKDSALDETQLKERKRLRKLRVAAIRYRAYRQAKERDDNAKENGEEDGDATGENWPPRIDLTIVQPMAGGLHGFIAAHRQGDTCRVAVHTPLWAEIVGFQYRSDRKISAGIVDATTGIVVEHDSRKAWSGMVFRPSEDIE